MENHSLKYQWVNVLLSPKIVKIMKTLVLAACILIMGAFAANNQQKGS